MNPSPLPESILDAHKKTSGYCPEVFFIGENFFYALFRFAAGRWGILLCCFGT